MVCCCCARQRTWAQGAPSVVGIWVGKLCSRRGHVIIMMPFEKAGGCRGSQPFYRAGSLSSLSAFLGYAGSLGGVPACWNARPGGVLLPGRTSVCLRFVSCGIG